ncbi:MAG: ABC transporter substrate-binding protein [Acidimicrobiales bacterium]
MSRGRQSPHLLIPAIVLSLAVALAGCTTSPSGDGPTTSSTLPGGVILQSGGTARIAVANLPVNFNPSTSAGSNQVTQMVMQQVWPQPFVTDPTLQTELGSSFLTSAEVQGISPFKVVYQINPKAKWSDGVPITAADFAYNWHEQLLARSTMADSGLVAGYRDIARVVGSGNGRTVTVTFVHPFAQWESLFSNLVPSHVALRYGWAASFQGFSPNRVVSGGAFEVASVRPGRDLVLKRNPQYWGTPAHLSEIEFVVVHSDTAAMRGLESGRLSFAEVAPSQSVPASVAGATRLGPPLRWSESPTRTLWQLAFNLGDQVVGEIAIRRGIEHALDPNEILADSAALSDGVLGVPVSRLVLGGTPPGTEPARTLYKPDLALRFFAQASYVPTGGGLLRIDPAGQPLTLALTVPSADPVVAQAAEVVQAELRAAGIVLHLRFVPLAQMLSTTLPGGSYQLAIAPFYVSPTIADLAPVYSEPVLSSAPINGAAPPWATSVAAGTEPGALSAGYVTRDIFGYSWQGVDADFAKALSDLNPATDAAELAKADEAMWNQVVSIPLFEQPVAMIDATSLLNVSESPTWAGVMWDAQDWAFQLKPSVPATSVAPSAVSSVGG